MGAVVREFRHHAGKRLGWVAALVGGALAHAVFDLAAKLLHEAPIVGRLFAG